MITCFPTWNDVFQEFKGIREGFFAKNSKRSQVCRSRREESLIVSRRTIWETGPRCRKAFTLIELLVVVAILALLAAILFPVFSRVRQNAYRTTCQSNLKQFGLCLNQYLQDNDTAYPFGLSVQTSGYCESGFDLVQPYVRNSQIQYCPADAFGPSIDLTSFGASTYSYGSNDLIFNSPDFPGGANPIMESVIVSPASVPTIYDAANHDSITPGSPFDPSSPSLDIQVDKRHFSGADCLLADGHVKWYINHPPITDATYPNDYWNGDPTATAP